MSLGRGVWLHVRFRSGSWVNWITLLLLLVVYYLRGEEMNIWVVSWFISKVLFLF